jgi:hypothetical protein
MLRLQRVTFTALHSYLGLTSEIMRIEKKNSKNQIRRHHHHHQHNRNSKKNSKDTELEHSNSDISSNDHSNEHMNVSYYILNLHLTHLFSHKVFTSIFNSFTTN